jgi:hypothetical protein
MLEFASPALMSSPSDLLAPGAPPEEFRERGLPLRLGVLTEQISPELVDQAVADAGRVQRRCRLLPARAVVSFVLALCLFSGADSSRPPGYRSVLRSLTTGLRQLRGIRLPTSAALTQARRRLGEAPLQLLLARLVGPLATPSTPGAFAFGRRVVAWDGSGIDVADTDDNVAAFGRASGTGYPQLRLLWLIECGTHALVDAVFDGYTVSEQKLAKRLVGALRPGMLLLADRNFPGHQLWGLAADTGADLAWRIKNHQVFWPGQPLPDGSFLSVMPTPAENVRYGQARAIGRQMPNPPQGHPVRIINYTVTISTPRRCDPHRGIPAGHHPARPPAGTSSATGRPVLAALGDRTGLRRPEDPPARRRVHPPVALPGARPAGGLRPPRRLPGPLRPTHPSRDHRRGRPRPDLGHRHHPPRPRSGLHPGRHDRSRIDPSLPADDRRPARRAPPRPATAVLRATQADPKEQPPDQTARPPPATQQHQMQPRNCRRPPLPGETRLSNRHWG